MNTIVVEVLEADTTVQALDFFEINLGLFPMVCIYKTIVYKILFIS